MKFRSESGSIYLPALFGILLIAVMLLVMFQSLEPAVRYLGKSDETYENERLLLEAADAVIERMAEDETPVSDSRFDLERLSDDAPAGMTITVIDESSRLNLNLFPSTLLNNDEVAALLGGSPPSLFRQFRADLGFTLDPAAYTDIIPARQLEDYFTVYGYANPNTVDPVHLYEFIIERTGDSGTASRFIDRLESFGGNPITPDDFDGSFSSFMTPLYPLVNAEAAWNVHFLDPVLLRAVLERPYDGELLENRETALGAIISLREQTELTPDDLTAIIDAAEGQELVYRYLGTVSWFRRITVKGGGLTLTVIVARIPPVDSIELRVVDRRFEGD